jgi:hypothetical protein
VRRVPFSLGTFSWASKRKYLALQGETMNLKNDNESSEKTVGADRIRELRCQ